MKLNKLLLMLGGVALMSLTSCDPKISSTTSGGGGVTSSTPNSTPNPDLVDDLTKKVTVNMSVMYQKANTRITFGGDSVKFPYEAANGKSYKSGDLKPVWEQVQDKLNIQINDKAPASADKIADAFKTMQAGNFEGVDIAQGSSADIIQQGTTSAGSIVNLADYLDNMPNFKKFLADNPIVKTNIQDANGAIYYAPYFDGYDDIERMLMLRADWVVKLLDSENPTFDSTDAGSTYYTPYMPDSLDTKIPAAKADGSGTYEITKKYTSGNGVIARQNKLSSKTGATLATALRDYIDTTYGDQYAKRSDLFLGQNAVYDADELIALFRAVRANTNMLTGQSEKRIVPFFPRANTNDRTADLWRFTQMWGVRGGESRSGYLYINDDGKIVDARGDVAMRDAIERLNQMYKEGLILANFTDATAVEGGAEFRKYLLQNNLGFSTYDYNQTTTILNNDAKCKAIDGFLFTSVLPAVANWRNDGKYFHFTESWRSVKTEGWFITGNAAKDKDVFKRCLTIFDYFYGEEGNTLMSYGPDAWIAHNADGSVKKMNYQGSQIPVLSDAALTELATLANGNYTNYYRYWLGATYPIGYVKQQGMEYQTVAEAAKPGLDKINKAIELGILKHITVTKNDDHFYDMVPTTFSFTAAEQNALKSNYVDLDNAINNTKGKTNIWSQIVIHGFGATVAGGTTLPTKDGYIAYVNALNLENFVKIYNAAYARMI